MRLVSSCIGKSLLPKRVHDAAGDQAGDRRHDQRAAEGHRKPVFPSVEEAKQAADEKDDPGGLPPALPIGHA